MTSLSKIGKVLSLVVLAQQEAVGQSARFNPVDFQYFTIEQAKETHAALTREVEKALVDARESVAEARAKQILKKELDWAIAELRNIRSPRKPYLPYVRRRHTCGDPARGGPGWAPPSEVEDGDGVMADALAKAAKAKPFDCSGTRCHVLVFVTPRAKGSEETVALCDVGKTAAGIGVPRDCHAVVVRREKQAFLRVFPFDTGVCQLSAFFRPSGAFGATYEIMGLPDGKDAVTEGLMDVLRGRPLALRPELENTERGGFLATAAFRVSPVLSGFRELLEVKVSVDGRETKRLKDKEPAATGQQQIQQQQPSDAVVAGKLRVTVTAWLNVCAQNSGNASDYFLPAEAQREQYLQVLRTAVRAGLSRRCPRGRWMDDYKLECGEDSKPPGG